MYCVYSDYSDSSEEDEEEEEDEEGGAAMKTKKKKTGIKVDINLSLSAYANATRYFKLCFKFYILVLYSAVVA